MSRIWLPAVMALIAAKWIDRPFPHHNPGLMQTYRVVADARTDEVQSPRQASSAGDVAQAHITALAFTPGGQQVLTGSKSGLVVHGWPKLNRIERIETQIAEVHDMAFAPDGERLIVVGGAASEYGELEVYSWPERKLLYSKVDHEDIIYGVAWDAAAQQFATAGGDHQVKVWNASDGSRQAALQGHSRRVLAVAFLPNAKRLVSAGVDQSLRVWDCGTWKRIRTLDNHTGPVRDLAVRPGDHGLPVVASASADRTIRLWQPTIGRMVRFARLPVEPLSVTWSRDGQFLLVGCTDGRLRVIHSDTLETVGDKTVLDGWVYEVAASPVDGSIACGGSAGLLRRLELDLSK